MAKPPFIPERNEFLEMEARWAEADGRTGWPGAAASIAAGRGFDLDRAVQFMWETFAEEAGGEEALLALMDEAGRMPDSPPAAPRLAELPGTALSVSKPLERALSGALERDAGGRALRHDGWTMARQVAFIDALRETACVETAARAVSKAPSGAYKLRERNRAFREAWNAALKYSALDLERVAMERALEGTEEAVFDGHGNQIGTRRRYNDRPLMFLLRAARPDKYGVGLTTEYGRGVHAERVAQRGDGEKA